MATERTEDLFVNAVCTIASRLPSYARNGRDVDSLRTRIRTRLSHYRSAREEWGLKEWSNYTLFRPIEAINTVWLVYVLFGQTFGAFVNCECQTSVWGPGGGYLDFQNWDSSNNKALNLYWSGGTTAALVVMGLALIYVVVEWCMQAHLSTIDYDAAARGLRRTRRFRRLTFPLRYPLHLAISAINFLHPIICKLFKRKPTHNNQATLVWTRSENYTAGRRRSSQPYLSRPSIVLNSPESPNAPGLGIEMHDYRFHHRTSPEYDPSMRPRGGSNASHDPLLPEPEAAYSMGSHLSPMLTPTPSQETSRTSEDNSSPEELHPPRLGYFRPRSAFQRHTSDPPTPPRTS